VPQVTRGVIRRGLTAKPPKNAKQQEKIKFSRSLAFFGVLAVQTLLLEVISLCANAHVLVLR
jgi:hypothetical protein